MMNQSEPRRFAALEDTAAGVMRTRATPKPTHRSKKDRKADLVGQGLGTALDAGRDEVAEVEARRIFDQE